MTIFNYAVFDGQLLPLDQAQISIFNPSLFSSFGIYETVKVDKGRPFYLDDHLHRLLQSARMLDMDLDVSTESLAHWFQMLVQVDPQATWSLKIIAFGPTDPTSKPIIAMHPTRLPTYPYALYQKGASVVLYEGQRLLPACKSLNTLVNYLARRKAEQMGALEGVLHYNGHLTEGARTNLFAVQNGQLVTAPTSDVLSGITRDVIVQVMQSTHHPVLETQLPIDLSLYEEMFISSTSMHVMPVTEVEGRPIGNGQVGPVTKVAMAQFDAHYRQYMESLQGVFGYGGRHKTRVRCDVGDS